MLHIKKQNHIINKGFSPLALRLFFLQAHYRSKQNFSFEALSAAQITLKKLWITIANLQTEKKEGEEEKGEINKDYKKEFDSELTDDFNTPRALTVLFNLLKSSLSAEDKLKTAFYFDTILGLDLEKSKMLKP